MKLPTLKPMNLPTILSWLIPLLVPVVLTLGAVRLVLFPWFVRFQYSMPGFPADPYGFTKQERLRYSRLALDYLLNDAGISYLGDLRFPQGQEAPPMVCLEMTDCTHLYTERELSHMVDVKKTVQVAMGILYISLASLVILGLWAWRGKWMGDFRRAVQRGGWLMVALIGVMLLFVFTIFDWFFTFFHNIFFAAGTWQFYDSDTLIRLFPEHFWVVTFIVVGGLAGLMGLALGIFLREKRVASPALIAESPPEETPDSKVDQAPTA